MENEVKKTEAAPSWISTDFPIILMLMLFAALLSIVFFREQSLRLDESQSIWQTSRTVMGMLSLVGKDVHVPLYHLILHTWQIFLGNDVAVDRLLSLVFFLLSIPAIYSLGAICYGRKTGIFVAALLTLSPFMNWYGNEIRMYSMFVLVAILHEYFFVKIWKRGDFMDWFWFALVSVCGMYTHYFFFLLVLCDMIFYFFHKEIFPKDAFKKFFKIGIFLIVCFLPWALFVIYLGGISSSEPALTAPSTVDLFNTFSQFLFGFQTDHLNTILVSLWPLTVFLGFLALRKGKGMAPETLYFLIVFLLPNVIAFIVSLTLSPIYLTRYLIFTIPSMYLFLGWLFSTYPKTLSLAVKCILIALMAATLVFEGVSASTPVKENYEEASTFLERNASASDIIVVSAPFTIYPMLYYYRGPATLTTLPIWNQEANGPIPAYSKDELVKDVATLEANHSNLWLLLSYDQGYQKDVELYFDTHYQKLYSDEFSPGLTLYEYKLRY